MICAYTKMVFVLLQTQKNTELLAVQEEYVDMRMRIDGVLQSIAKLPIKSAFP